MPLEFALRPRIRLDVNVAPKRRAPRLPRFALPIALYWSVAAGITYAVMHAKEVSRVLGEVTSAKVQPRPLRVSAPKRAARVAPAVALSNAQPVPETALAPPPEPNPEVPTREETAALAPEIAELSTGTSGSPRTPAAPRFAAPEPEPAQKLRLDSATPAIADALQALPPLSPGDHFSFDDAARATKPAPSDERTAEPAREMPRGGPLPSCEAAAATNNEELDFAGHDRTADLPITALTSVLENGAWFASCGVPEHTALDICVAVISGRVAGVTVSARPADTNLSACIRRRAARLAFPFSSHLDIARTHFAAP